MPINRSAGRVPSGTTALPAGRPGHQISQRRHDRPVFRGGGNENEVTDSSRHSKVGMRPPRPEGEPSVGTPVRSYRPAVQGLGVLPALCWHQAFKGTETKGTAHPGQGGRLPFLSRSHWQGLSFLSFVNRLLGHTCHLLAKLGSAAAIFPWKEVGSSIVPPCFRG